jgi:hypothetical protein
VKRRLTFALVCRANATSKAIDYAKFPQPLNDAVIRAYDDAGNVTETHEHKVQGVVKSCGQSASGVSFRKEGKSLDIFLWPNQDAVANPSCERAHCVIEKETQRSIRLH